MKPCSITLTETEKIILSSYQASLGGLSAYLGSSYELVLHSLDNLEHSVIAIYNGERSGRRIGAPVTDLGLQMLSRIEDEGAVDSITYLNRTRTGEPLRSTTIVIRGEQNRPIGLLCINFYLNTTLNQLIQECSCSGYAHPTTMIETLADEADDLVSDTLKDIRRQVEADDNISPQLRNKEIISRLQDCGIFNLKNAVMQVSGQLGISKNTVYLHLRNSEKK